MHYWFLMTFVAYLLVYLPLKEEIDISVSLLFEDDLNITKAKLKSLFEFETSDTYFIFTVYDTV